MRTTRETMSTFTIIYASRGIGAGSTDWTTWGVDDADGELWVATNTHPARFAGAAKEGAVADELDEQIAADDANNCEQIDREYAMKWLAAVAKGEMDEEE